MQTCTVAFQDGSVTVHLLRAQAKRFLTFRFVSFQLEYIATPTVRPALKIASFNQRRERQNVNVTF